MLTVGQHIVVERLAEAILFAIRSAYVNKPLKRISLRFENGKQVRREFQAPVNASGNLSAQTRYEISDTSLIFYAPSYIYELIYGKRPATNASDIDHNLESSIRSWMEKKRIGEGGTIEIMGKQIDIESDKDKIAYLITNKIQKYGNSIWLYGRGQDSGLLNNIITPNLIKDYNSKFTRQLEIEISQI